MIMAKLADMKTNIEAARLLTYRAAWLADQGESNTEAAAHAKRFAADIATEATIEAVQIFGGFGYTEEYPVARLMRAAKVMQIYEGSSEIQRLIIGREITRDL
jgi:alkylation response protein AidB-like acyl-CoA dehydrogenase